MDSPIGNYMFIFSRWYICTLNLTKCFCKLIKIWHFFSDPGQHGLQLESMVASGGVPSPVDTELSTPAMPKVPTVEEEDEGVDSLVAEMNRKNAQRSQQQTEKDVKSSENIPYVKSSDNIPHGESSDNIPHGKSSENIHNVKSSDNIQHQSKDGVKRPTDQFSETGQQNIMKRSSSPSQSGAKGSKSQASGNSSKYCLQKTTSK